ncbi:MAG: EF-hand domain-containing protein [Roseibium sp.]|nr:EF-hand domain-containing protein [Roseibium sp.]
MKPFKTIAIAVLTAGVASTALTAASTASARDMGGWWGGGKHQGWMMGGRGGGRGDRLFDRFDADDDGAITQAEVDAQAAAMFTAADTNTDGAVDLEEFRAELLNHSEDRRVRAFQRLDRDGDGTVTLEEYNGVSDRMFNRMDRNDDGVLERVRGHRGGGQQGAEREPGGETEEAGRRGRGGGWGGPGRMGPIRMVFATFDTDNDGKMTRAEFEEVRGNLFASADRNGSGGFGLEDFTAIWTTLTNGPTVRMFQHLDANGDLAVTPEEQAARTADLVSRLDRNDDGVLTRADLRRGGKHGWRDRGGKDRHQARTQEGRN